MKKKMRAALLYAPNTPVSVEEIEIDDPKPGEVRVKIEAAGLCHTDLQYIRGTMGGGSPMVLGHEGAGIVESVGEGVTTLKEGDHVVMGVLAPCGKCQYCVAGITYMCENCAVPMLCGTQLEGSSRLSKDGKEVYHCFSQSAFAEYAVVGEFTAAKVRDDAPFDKICGIACAIGTGLGAVVKHPRFHMEVGAKVAVIGCGTVGLSAIMGANLVGAGKIVAIDMFENKLALAKELGATHTINASKEDPVARTVLEVGTVDYAFECIGKAVTVNQAYDMTNMQGGVVVVVGAMPMGEMVSFEGFYLGTCAKSVVGVGAGFMSPKYDVPRYVDLYMNGKLPLDKLVTHHYKLEDVNQAIEDLEKGVSVKGVILP